MKAKFYSLLSLIAKNPLTLTGFLGLIILLIIALFAPQLAPYPQDARGATHTGNNFLSPSSTHPFGTDEMGRDILSRVLFGARISLQIGVIAIGIALLIGIPLGVLAGYSGGWGDEIIMRITDVFLSFPPLLLAMAISVTLGPSLTNAMIAIAIAWWPWYTRLLRGEVTSVKERSFIEAARAMGTSRLKIIFRHLLPNSIMPIVIQSSMDFGSVILTSASLSFLGLGAQAPTPEWGLMVSTGRTYFLTKWWVVTFPGLAIFITVLSFNLIGDGLRELLDPKTRREMTGY